MTLSHEGYFGRAYYFGGMEAQPRGIVLRSHGPWQSLGGCALSKLFTHFPCEVFYAVFTRRFDFPSSFQWYKKPRKQRNVKSREFCL